MLQSKGGGPPVARGSHAANDDPRNATIKIYVDGELLPREDAKVSVYDSGFMLGDGIWEGLRVYRSKVAFLEEHFDRLYESAKALDLEIGLSRAELEAALYRTLKANAMTDGVHLRLMVTRGRKCAPFQDPRLSIFGSTVVIIAEHNRPEGTAAAEGLKLFTVHVHRQAPDAQDPKLNSHSKLNCVTALIQALKAGADEALMLDPQGFVNTCNSTNFFIVRKGEVWTSTGDHCINGVTRGKIIALCRENAIPVFERNYSLADVYGADEAFVTGTCGAQTPVVQVDGRVIGEGKPGPMFQRLRGLYKDLVERHCAG
ncbi:MAG: aminotransferase class IV [Pseudomonadota bacterium]